MIFFYNTGDNSEHNKRDKKNPAKSLLITDESVFSGGCSHVSDSGFGCCLVNMLTLIVVIVFLEAVLFVAVVAFLLVVSECRLNQERWTD